jgi:hypothetical protein
LRKTWVNIHSRGLEVEFCISIVLAGEALIVPESRS